MSKNPVENTCKHKWKLAEYREQPKPPRFHLVLLTCGACGKGRWILGRTFGQEMIYGDMLSALEAMEKVLNTYTETCIKWT